VFKRSNFDEKFVSITGTVVIHGLILIIFFFIQIDFQPVIEKFTEVAFTGSWVSTSRAFIPQTQYDYNVGSPITDGSNIDLPDEIELPERRQLDLNEQEIIEKVQPELEKLMASENVVKKSPAITPTLPETQDTGPVINRREKPIAHGLFNKKLDEKLLNGTQKIQIKSDQQFEIDWEGEIRREIYQKNLPEFPPEVQRGATIKIQFTVLPSGLVGSAVLLQKGDTRLENLTLETFKTWRFNPLPEYVEQVPQTGIITFHFKLR
jgi:TonB family protein